MGLADEVHRGCGGGVLWAFRSLMRRKLVDNSGHVSLQAQQQQLAKELSVLQLIAIGVGSTIGAGVYVLVGTVAREHSGPALTISFLVAGIAAALSAFCYAELASRCPSAGSAYHYSYICVGEGVAWLIGWALVLEYTIGGSAVARGISPNLALFFGGQDSLPAFLARAHIPGLDIVVDPCAAILVLIVTGLLCVGIKESALAQAVVTSANVCVMVFVIIAGGYLGFRTGWVGYSLPTGYFPFGVNGMLAGSATVFFAYIGFDSVASTAEEVKNPQRDLPLGIGIALSICCVLYMLVSVVIVGLVPYYSMDADTPISSAFSSNGMQWAAYIIAAGATTALCSTLMGSILPQPRILMAMARDGLLPSFFSDVNERTQVPVKSTIVTGICSAILAFCMDVSQLAGMVSVGTLLAFTIVAVSILILRYVPPDEVPLPSSMQDSIDSLLLQYDKENNCEGSKYPSTACNDLEVSTGYPLIVKEVEQDKLKEQKRRLLRSIEPLGMENLSHSIQNVILTRTTQELCNSFVFLRNLARRHQTYTKLRDFAENYWRTNPENFLINGHVDLDKRSLIELLRRDDIDLPEDRIWDKVITWAMCNVADCQRTALIPITSTDKWSPRDFRRIRKVLRGIIPHVRFYNMTAKHFALEVAPYARALPSGIFLDALRYHMIPDYETLYPKRPVRGRPNQNNA